MVPLFGLTLIAAASSVTVQNFSFENDILADDAFNFDGAGWIESGGNAAGAWNPTSQITPTHGNNVGFINQGDLSQEVGTIEANTMYTLSVDVGCRSDMALQNYEVQLYSGITVLAFDDSTALTFGRWATSTIRFNSAHFQDLIGDPFGIRLIQKGTQSNTFDNVLLDKTAVPIPPAILLLGSGLVGIIRFKRS